MAGGERPDVEIARGVDGATVFVSDPSVEAERVGRQLRASGYLVVDVPLAMLVARVAVQRPRVVLLDADSDGALDVVARMRELADAEGIDVLFFSRDGGAIRSTEDALAHEASGMFTRPLDVDAVVKKVDALTGGVAELPSRRVSSRPPPPSSLPASSAPSSPLAISSPPSSPIPISSAPSSSPAGASLPPASMRAPEPGPSSKPPTPRPSSPRISLRPSSLSVESPGALGGDPARKAPSAPLSSELEALLAEAELRVPSTRASEAPVQSPEDEIEAVLPADLLDALDEPLTGDDDDAIEIASSGTGRSTGTRSTTSAQGTGTSSTPRRTTTGSRDEPESVVTPAPPKTHGGGTHSGTTGSSSVPTTGEAERARARAAPPAPVSEDAAPEPSPRAASYPPPTPYSPATHDRVEPPRGGAAAATAAAFPPAVLGKGDAARLVARAIAARASGAVAIETADGVRRAILRDGDLVTVASTADDESLLSFLGVRGELPRETVRRLASKFPGFGRHAGAALVAQGYLRQDQLWPVLRAHAEWILGRALQAQSGTAIHETEAPERLRAEPGVFGGSTGAEVLVEVLRRVVPPADALERLGGGASRLDDGEASALLSECALGPTELEVVSQARGRSIDQLLEAAPESDIATVLYALWLLGVVSVLRGVGPGAGAGAERDGGVDPLDEEAIRARVHARLEVVNDGDYFALLGVAHDATGYEIRRAFLELRRAFEPSRILTPEVADLADDVRKIVAVLEEAYEILRDAPRRERYRRAIDAVP